jgi:hypothetical protein
MILRKDEEYFIEMFNKLNNHTNNAYKLLEKCKILCGPEKNLLHFAYHNLPIAASKIIMK